MKKVINARLPLLCAIILILGTVAGYLSVFYNLNAFWLAASVISVAVSFIMSFIFCKSKNKVLIYLILSILFFVGLFGTEIRLKSYNSNEYVNGGTYEVSGVVTSKEQAEQGYYVLLNSLKIDGKHASGKMYAFIQEGSCDFYDLGYKLNFKAALQNKEAFSYNKFNSDAAKGIKYYCRVYYGVSAQKTFSPLLKINSSICNILYKYLDETTASVACAMLTGNTNGVDEGVLSAYRYGGIAHIFAVSGLHIGLIYGALRLILKKCKLNNGAVAIIGSLSAFLYAGVCGFAASSLRAAIMCSTQSVAKLTKNKYDGINAMSVAAIILLIINPLWLFTVGFLLSFGAVASILFLSNNLGKLLNFLPKKLSSSIAVSLSAQLGTLPVLLVCFGYISVAGLALNPIAIPILSFIFILLFACTLISLIIPPLAAPLIQFAAAPLKLCISAVNVAGFENAILSYGGIPLIAVFAYFTLLVILSGRVNVKFPTRIIASSAISVCIAAFVLVSVFSPFTGVNVTVCANYNGEGVLIKRSTKSVLVLSENCNLRFVQNTVNSNCFVPPSAAVILCDRNVNIAIGAVISTIECVYISEDAAFSAEYGGVEIYNQNTFSLLDIKFEFVDSSSLYVKIGGATIGISMGEQTGISECDLFISNTVQKEVKCSNTVYFNLKDYKFNVYDSGDLIFEVKNDKIRMKNKLQNKKSVY